MENETLKWCFKLKDGLKILEPNERLAKSYLEQAKMSLGTAEKNFKNDDLLWATVVTYYSDYYALYSFLQRIGIKCENHHCSISAATYLLGEDKTSIINDHKNKRIDAQYYIKIGKQEEIKKMLNEAKKFVSFYDELTLNIIETEIQDFRRKLTKNNIIKID